MNGTLHGSRLSVKRQDSEINPMDGLANLADCMLVLACGLLLSLIIHWDVDIIGTEVVMDPDAEVQQIEVEEGQTPETAAGDEGFTRYGAVYVDKDGNYYVVEEGEPVE